MQRMPKVPELRGSTPVNVLDAVAGLGSELRLRLLRHYLEHPGSQADAARALDVPTNTITTNTKRLVALGLVIGAPVDDDKRTSVYSVDLDRFDDLLRVLHDYLHQARPHDHAR